jgi:hypothetical protein
MGTFGKFWNEQMSRNIRKYFSKNVINVSHYLKELKKIWKWFFNVIF